jgi:transcriptional regulator with XRE-family HTH domain
MFVPSQPQSDLDLRAEARRLRRDEGNPLRTIAARLGVSPSTVHQWTRGINLTSEQREAIRHSEAARRARAAGNAAMRTRARQKRLAAQDHGRHLARQGSVLHASGCMLYWAEGSKRRNDVEFTNSDPDLMRTFVEFLTRCHGVRSEAMSLTVNVHLNNGLRLSEVEEWWLTRLHLPRSCLGSHTVNRSSRTSSQPRRRLPYGTARLVVHSTFIVQSIYGAIQEYARIERPEWLDL